MAARRAAREQRRAKILLAVLVLVLAGVCGFWGARALVRRSGGAVRPVAATETAGASRPVAATEATETVLRSFAGLRPRDLFRPQASNETSAAPAPAKPAPAPPAPAQTIAIAPPAAKPAQPAGPLLPAALLKLNGTRQVVVVGAAFPKSRPAFRLTAVGRSAMWISLLHGSFADGRQLLQVVHGRPAKLVGRGAEPGRVSFLLALVRVTARHVPPAPPKPAATVVTTTAPFTVATAPAATTAADAVTTGP